MSITISHASALYSIRTLRCDGKDVRYFDHAAIARPSTWVGKRWTMREFTADEWKWQRPSPSKPLHVLVRKQTERPRLQNVQAHVYTTNLPPNAILWLDEYATISSPELVFVQMAESLSLPELVLLGYELCGYYSKSPNDPSNGPVVDNIRNATTVEELRRFADCQMRLPGIELARKALEYVAEPAASVPEAILSMMYSLPTGELGYGMGPITLNRRVATQDDAPHAAQNRYPDLMFPFAPVGINYEGKGHLDLDGLEQVIWQAILAGDSNAQGDDSNAQDDDSNARELLVKKIAEIRDKAYDDILRNRQLAARGKIVLQATKRDLYDKDGLDHLTKQILQCARETFGVDTSAYEKALNNTKLCSDRYNLLMSLLPHGRSQP